MWHIQVLFGPAKSRRLFKIYISSARRQEFRFSTSLENRLRGSSQTCQIRAVVAQVRRSGFRTWKRTFRKLSAWNRKWLKKKQKGNYQMQNILFESSTKISDSLPMYCGEQHYWLWAGDPNYPLPEGYPCACGMMLWHKEKCKECGSDIIRPVAR